MFPSVSMLLACRVRAIISMSESLKSTVSLRRLVVEQKRSILTGKESPEELAAKLGTYYVHGDKLKAALSPNEALDKNNEILLENEFLVQKAVHDLVRARQSVLHDSLLHQQHETFQANVESSVCASQEGTRGRLQEAGDFADDETVFFSQDGSARKSAVNYGNLHVESPEKPADAVRKVTPAERPVGQE